MTLQEARSFIRDDSIGPIGWAMAAAVIHESTQDDPLNAEMLEDLLIALGRGPLAASTAICALGYRTNRQPNPDGWLDRDPEGWRVYLRENGYLDRQNLHG